MLSFTVAGTFRRHDACFDPGKPNGGSQLIGRLSDIDLRLLRIFATVVESGGFSLATARLNVSESTVSQHMSDLEKRLGMRLCERGRAGFRLTRDGDEVYKATLELLEDLGRFRDRLALLRSDMSGTLNLGMPDAIVTDESSGFAERIRTFVDSSRDIALHVHMLTPRELERGVIDGSLHVAVAPEHRRVAGLDYVPLFVELNRLYCGREHPLFEVPDERVTDAMLADAGRISRGYLERFDEQFFGNARYAASVQLTEAAALLILSGRYIGFLPVHYAAAWVREGRMRAVQPDRFRLESRFNVIRKREGAADPRVETLVRELVRGRGPSAGPPSRAPAALDPAGGVASRG
jgi:DNA-binding transcriptional LysR family regulator